MGELIVGLVAIAGGAFVCLAGVGVVRFSDLYSRMHAATKATTTGIALIGIAGALSIDNGAAKILLATAIIFVTAPSAAHFIGRAAYRAEGLTVRLDTHDDLHDLTHSQDEGDGDR